MSKFHYIIPIFVPDLGCPHRCVFCNQKKITGREHVPTPDEVREKIAGYLETIPGGNGIIKEVAFYGGSFTAVDRKLQRELLAPAYRLLADGKIDRIRVSTRPDAISEDILAMLAAFGVSTVELGVQSMDDQVLLKSGRGHTGSDVMRAAELIRSWGLVLGLQMMIGLPGDTEEKDIQTAAELVLLKPDMVRIYPCLVLKGTILAELYEKREYTPLTLDEAVMRCRKLLVMFEKEGIRVIRIGLQPSEQIALDGDVLTGPYHPAFRELVETAAAREVVAALLINGAGVTRACSVQLAVPETDVSIVRGHRGINVEYFTKEFGLNKFITGTDSGLCRGDIRLEAVDGQRYGLLMSRKELPVY